MAQNLPNSIELPQFPESYWIASTPFRTYPKLQDSISVDAVIVGAGLTGVTTAYLLAKEGLQVALLDAGTIATGTSGHTTAKITAQHDLIYDEFISHFGTEQARLYYEANHQALQWMKELIRRERIDCDFQEQDAYLYTTAGDMAGKLEQEFRAYEKLGIPGSYVDQVPLDPLGVKAAVVMPGQAQFHPLRYLRYLLGEFAALGGQIYEQTEATGVESGERPRVLTKEGHRVTGHYVVAATHYPFHEGMGLYFARMHPERSYAIACPLPDEQADYPGGMYLNVDDPKRSVRSVQIGGKHALLLGGEGHQTGQGICTHRHYEALQQFAQQTFGLSAISYRWSAQDLISLDKLPYIGPVTAGNDRVLVATGYRKWGMTTSAVAAHLLKDYITERSDENPYRELFTPSRFNADPGLKTLLVETGDVIKHLVTGKLEWAKTMPEDIGGSGCCCNDKWKKSRRLSRTGRQAACAGHDVHPYGLRSGME